MGDRNGPLARGAWHLAQRHDHGDPSANQFGRQRGQPVGLIIRPAVFDRYVLALHIASVFEPLSETAQTARERVRRCGVGTR